MLAQLLVGLLVLLDNAFGLFRCGVAGRFGRRLFATRPFEFFRVAGEFCLELASFTVNFELDFIPQFAFEFELSQLSRFGFARTVDPRLFDFNLDALGFGKAFLCLLGFELEAFAFSTELKFRFFLHALQARELLRLPGVTFFELLFFFVQATFGIRAHLRNAGFFRSLAHASFFLGALLLFLNLCFESLCLFPGPLRARGVCGEARVFFRLSLGRFLFHR